MRPSGARDRALQRTALGGLFALSACTSILGINGDRPLAEGPDGPVPTTIEGGADAGTAPATDSAGPTGEADSRAEAGPPALDPVTANARADDAVEAMLLAFWNQTDQYLVATAPQPAPPVDADLGSYSQAWDAVLDAATRHKGARFAGTIATLWNTQNALGWAFSRYDQESLMSLALMRLYDATGNNTYLLEARTLYEDVRSAWNDTCCQIPPSNVFGGIWQDTAHTQKSTVANAAAVIAGAGLYARTKLTTYLSFAQQVYAYWSANMVDPVSHQVAHGVAPSGIVDHAIFTVNEGLMIGAATELAKVTQDPKTLTLAHQMAGFMLTNETATVPGIGAVLSDGDDTACQGDCAQYKGLAARYLGALYAADGAHTEYKDLLLRSGLAAWTVARDANGTNPTHLYNIDWASPFPGPSPSAGGTLAATASAAMVLSAVASIKGSPPADPADTYQAEEGQLYHQVAGVGLSNQEPALGGWGYVSNWGCPIPCAPAAKHDGSGVDFPITAPGGEITGLYALDFTYGAVDPTGANPSYARQVLVNGSTFATTAFPTTGKSWTGWANQLLFNVWLPPGANTVSVLFDSTQGGSGIVELDQLQVSENLMKAQPRASDWTNSFLPVLTLNLTDTTVTTASGKTVPATRWQGSNVPSGNWMKIYPNSAPFSANLVPTRYYVASITVSGGAGTLYYLDFFDGAPGGDIAAPSNNGVPISSTPQTFTTARFQLLSASPPEFQLRLPPQGNVTVDVTISNLAIFPAP